MIQIITKSLKDTKEKMIPVIKTNPDVACGGMHHGHNVHTTTNPANHLVTKQSTYGTDYLSVLFKSTTVPASYLTGTPSFTHTTTSVFVCMPF